MARKVNNNKVEFSANGTTAVFRLSDKELAKLRTYSDGKKHNSWGMMHNFSVFAFFDYETTPSKSGRFNSLFNYHKFDKIMWQIV
jgi:hypothetical protein